MRSLCLASLDLIGPESCFHLMHLWTETDAEFSVSDLTGYHFMSDFLTIQLFVFF